MGGSSKTTQSSTTAPTPFAGAAYTGAITDAQGVANTPYNPATNQSVAGLTPDQLSAFGQIGGLQGIQTPYLTAATNYANMGAAPISSAAIQGYLNPYTDAVVNSTLANIKDNNAQQQQQLNGNAAIQGALGGDRSAVAQAELARQQDLATNQTIAGLQSQGFNTALSAAQQDAGRQMQTAYTLGNLGQEALSTGLQGSGALLSAGNQQQAQTQAGLNAGTQNAVQQTMWPYQNLQYLASIEGALGPLLGGTTNGTTTQSPPSPLGSIIGGGLALLSSDKRLKENIKPIGKAFDGQTIYKYNYKGDPTTRIGLIAQQVEKKHPEAVGIVNGFKAVDYDKATKDAEHKGHFASGGGVMVPYRRHYDSGGSVFNMSSMPFNMGGDNALSSILKSAQPHFPTLPSAPQQNQQGNDPLSQYKQMKGYQDLGKNASSGLSNVNNTLGNAFFGSTPTVSDGGWSTSTQPSGGFLSGLGDFLGFAKGGEVRKRYDIGGTVDDTGSGFLPFFGADDVSTYNGGSTPLMLASNDDGPKPIQDKLAPVPLRMTDAPITASLPDNATTVHSETYGPLIQTDARQMQTVTAPQDQDQTVLPLTSYYPKIRSAESSGNDYSQAKTSSAFGPYQFTAGTWSDLVKSHPDLGLTDADRLDPAKQQIAVEAFTKDNAAILKDKGFDPTNQANLYASHVLGPQGGPRFLDALKNNPNAPAISAAAPDQVAANHDLFYNKDGTPKTVSDLYNSFANKVSAPAQGQTQQPQQGNLVSRTLSSLGLTDATGTAATPTGKGILSNLGIPDWNPLGLNNNQRNALLTAGLAMIGNRSPFPSVQIGEGGLTGMQAYQTGQQQERQAELKAKELQQQAEQHRLQLEDTAQRHAETTRHNMATEGFLKNQYASGMGMDADGNLVKGSWTVQNGNRVFVPGMIVTQGRNGIDPAPARMAQWLVDNKIAPDLKTGYGLASQGVNSGSAFVRAVQAEKNRISKDQPGSMSDADMETLARKNVMDRARLAGEQLTKGQQPAPTDTQQQPQPQAPTKTDNQPGWWERNAPEFLGGKSEQPTPTQSQPQTPSQTQTVPNPLQKTAPSAPIAPTPPSNIPTGALYSPSRRMWKAPDGRRYDEAGRPLDMSGRPIALPQLQ